jgi:hypothetical protein
MLARKLSLQIRVLLIATLFAALNDWTMRAQSTIGGLPLSFEVNRGQTDDRFKFLSRGDGYTLYLDGNGAEFRFSRRRSATGGGSLANPATSKLKRIAISPMKDEICMTLAGANAEAPISGAEELLGKVNYFLGNDPSQWRSNIPTYGKVRYSGVYDGVDLVFYGNQRRLEYDFVVAPKADAEAIRVVFSGQRRLELTAKGDLILRGRVGTASFRKPLIYQERNGERVPVGGGFRLLAGDAVGFRIGRYDRTRPLIVDPILVYATYLGGSDGENFSGANEYDQPTGGDQINAVAADSSGNVYVAGQTDSTDFPVTSGAYQGANKGAKLFAPTAFVSKLNAAGTALIYSTYFGGSGIQSATVGIGGDSANALAIDASGNVYLAGATYSTDFPVSSGAYQSKNPNAASQGPAAFLAKLNATGSSLVYSSYLGGGAFDVANGIAVDVEGKAYVAGVTQSKGFPVTAGAVQTELKGASTGFVSKFNAAGTGLAYSTYLGGSGGDAANALAVDIVGSAYITGSTSSSDFPTTPGAFEKKYATVGLTNAFVAKLNPEGTVLVYSTYLGGGGFASGSGNAGFDLIGASIGDVGSAIAVDGDGNAYIAGSTASYNFPVTAGAFQTTDCITNINPQGQGTGDAVCQRAFVTKLNPAGGGLVYSTYLGGSGVEAWVPEPFSMGYDLSFEVGDAALGVAVDKAGNAYVSGLTFSSDFPVTGNAVQSVNQGYHNIAPVAFLSALNPTGSALLYSTYLGGRGTVNTNGDFFGNQYPGTGDGANAVALDSSGNAYVAGQAYSSNFPVSKGAFQTENQNGFFSKGFVAKLDLSSVVLTAPTVTKLTASSSSEPFAQPVVFTAKVAPASGSGIPTGSVLFTADGAPVATGALNSAGLATYQTATLKVGKHLIGASYGGNSAFGVSTSSLTETITESLTASPVFSLAAGVYTEVKTVTIADATKGAEIYYTTNGETPTTASTKYTSAGIKVTATETIQAIAVAPGDLPSAVVAATYKIHLPLDEPALSVKAGTYASAQTVSMLRIFRALPCGVAAAFGF